jgi:hypothetical protein
MQRFKLEVTISEFVESERNSKEIYGYSVLELALCF